VSQQVLMQVRDVTDSEIAHYKEKGWVKLDQLISADAAGDLLTRAKGFMGDKGDTHEPRPGRDKVNTTTWNDYHDIADDDQLFGALGYSKKVGHLAQRLMDRDVPVRIYTNTLAVKLGTKQNTVRPGTGTSPWHQDFPSLPFDRVGFLTFWIALDEVTPEMGAMRFYSGSQRLGSLGRVNWFDGKELVDVYPNLEANFPLSPPLHYNPGDATVHHSLVVHGAPRNETDRPRWPFIVSYFPADTKFNGGLAPESHRGDAKVLMPGQPFDSPRFRQVFP
jgi:Phytanoyl-CoA dioxygenase (PhyH)